MNRDASRLVFQLSSSVAALAKGGAVAKREGENTRLNGAKDVSKRLALS